jgi:hypothetical protein
MKRNQNNLTKRGNSKNGLPKTKKISAKKRILSRFFREKNIEKPLFLSK